MKRKKQFNSYEKIIFSNFKETPWPCFLMPASDELFSSWLTRVARNHLLRFYAFCSSHFSGVEFWNRDLDRTLPELIRSRITAKCVIRDENINQMLLSSYYSNLFIAPLESRSFWITQLNFYPNRKHDFGLSACPQCLKTDGTKAYYRKTWRLASTTVCTKCGTELIDRCPNCDSPINFLLSERGKKFQAPLFSITCCWKCLFNLSQTPSTPASSNWINTQAKIDKYISDGHAMERQLQYSHLYFDVLKKMISLLNKVGSPQLIKMQELICRETNLQFDTPLDNRLHPFNTASVKIRGNLIRKAYWLLDDWPDRFRKITASIGLKSKLFLDDFADCPYWFKNEISSNNKLVYSEWRKSHSEYSYSSFNEFAAWQVSKSLNNKPVGKNLRKSQLKN